MPWPVSEAMTTDEAANASVATSCAGRLCASLKKSLGAPYVTDADADAEAEAEEKEEEEEAGS